MKYLILLKIRNMMDIKEVLLQRFIHFLIKKTSVSGIKSKNISNKKLAEELHKPIIKKLIKEKYIDLLLTIFGVLICKKYLKITSIYPLYLMLNKINQYFEKISGNKYLTLVSTNKSKENNKKKYEKLWIK